MMPARVLITGASGFVGGSLVISLMVMTCLLVFGLGDHGRSVAEAAELSSQVEVVGFLGDSLPAGETVPAVPVLGPMASMAHRRAFASQAIVAIGNNEVREKLMKLLAVAGFESATDVHPGAIVSLSAALGKRAAVMAGAIVGNEVHLGVGSIVNCGAAVDHHASLEDLGHLGVNASMAGGTVQGSGAWMHAGVALGYEVKLAAGKVLVPGAGRLSKQTG